MIANSPSTRGLRLTKDSRSVRFLRWLIAGLILAIRLAVPDAVAHAKPKGLDGYQIVRVAVRTESDLQALIALDEASRGFEIWSDRPGIGYVDVRVPPDQKVALDATGLAYEIVIQDLQRHIDEVFAGPGDLGFFDAYRSYDEHVAFMEGLVTDYPQLAEMVNLGTSVLGRPLWAIRITGPGNDKPGVMYHGAQHGDEVMGAAVIAYLAQHLLVNYETDPDVRTLVDGVEWFLLPIMNPDGYEDGDRFNANSADLNRDWGGPGANPNPFSEPETAAMRDFFLGHSNVKAHVDLHSFGRMILWPWGYTVELCEDNATFGLLGERMAEQIFQVRGTSYSRRGPIHSTIYQVIGTSVDYTYSAFRSWAFVLELSTTFYPPPSEIVPTSMETSRALVFLSSWVVDCNENGVPDPEDIAQGVSQDCNANRTPDECEIMSDLDGDGIVDVCDTDIDNDGVLNEFDECNDTPTGTPVDERGRPRGDTNADCDLDLYDLWRFNRCLIEGGPAGTPPDFCLAYFDYDANARVDLVDAARYMQGFTGDRN